MYGDGGGKAASIPHPLHGRTQVARFLAGIGRQARLEGTTTAIREVNGQPAIDGTDREGRVIGVLTLEIVDGATRGVRVDPDKLGHLQARDALD